MQRDAQLLQVLGPANDNEQRSRLMTEMTSANEAHLSKGPFIIKFNITGRGARLHNLEAS